jgi:hypothetical protein
METPALQLLIGLGHLGEVLHTEVLPRLQPVQLMAVAHARLVLFARVEVWDETVCVLRCPPQAPARAA